MACRANMSGHETSLYEFQGLSTLAKIEAGPVRVNIFNEGVLWPDQAYEPQALKTLIHTREICVNYPKSLSAGTVFGIVGAHQKL